MPTETKELISEMKEKQDLISEKQAMLEFIKANGLEKKFNKMKEQAYNARTLSALYSESLK